MNYWGTGIHYPIKNPKKDLTGLIFLGRNRDGRYTYESFGTSHREMIVNLTHEERVGVAVLHEIGSKVYGPYEVNPMKDGGYYGRGSYGQRRMWIAKRLLKRIGKSYLRGDDIIEALEDGFFSTFIHEIGHNRQKGGRPHGPEFRRAMDMASVDVGAWIKKNGWPKLGKLKDTKPDHIKKAEAKKARKAEAASEPRSSKWKRSLVNAESKLKEWQAKQRRAEALVSKWEKKVAHSQRWLAKALEEDA